MRSPVTAIVVVYNEECRIAPCLAALRPVCDEILLIDQESTDSTVPLAAPYADRILTDVRSGLAETSLPLGENTAFYTWQLFLAADERLTERFITMLPGLLESPVDGFHLMTVSTIDGVLTDTTYPYRLYRRWSIEHTDRMHEGPNPHEGATTAVIDFPCILHDKSRAEQDLDDERYRTLR